MVHKPNGSPHLERLIALLEGRRDQIIGTFRQRSRRRFGESHRLPDDGSHVVGAVLDDMVAALGQRRNCADPAVRSTGASDGSSQEEIETQDRCGLLWSLAILFEVVLTVIVGTLTDYAPDELPLCAFSAITLQRSILTQLPQLTGGPCPDAAAGHLSGEDRRRMARELHDRVGNGIAAALTALDAPDDAYGRELASRALRDTLTDLGAITRDLRAAPRAAGLGLSLRDYQSCAGGDAAIHVRMSGDETVIAPVVRDEIYFATREAMRNAVRHANASLITVDIAIGDEDVSVTVTDDGVGFDERAVAARAGGLVTIRERAELVGGRATVTSTPGQGTVIGIVVPLPGGRREPPG